MPFLCPLDALQLYIDRTHDLWLYDRLFVCFANLDGGKALSTQKISHWVVEAIYLAQQQGSPSTLQCESTFKKGCGYNLLSTQRGSGE